MTAVYSPRYRAVKTFLIALGVLVIDELSNAAVKFTGPDKRVLNTKC